MSNMIINVDFLPGTTIEEAIAEAKKMADSLDVAYVKFNFNGKRLSIGRNADVFDVVEEYKNTSDAYIVHS